MIEQQRSERTRHAIALRISSHLPNTSVSMQPDLELLRIAEKGAISPTPLMDEWAKLRAKHIRSAAARAMPPAEVERWMDTHNLKLERKKPTQGHTRKPQARERSANAL